MSKMYDKIKRYYDEGLWSKTRVRNVALKGVITAEEYRWITGEDLQYLKTGGVYGNKNTGE